MKVLMVSIVAMMFAVFHPEDKLTGRWETKPSDKGTVMGLLFKSDSNFEGYINKKPFVSGTYTYKDDTFTFVDNGCDGMKGVYKIEFFSNVDSLRFKPIADSCDKRRERMIRLVMGKVK
ncbi:hypothetical protein GFS24_26985 [Chitinophaga sp. SYP-B3965]|uniref:hypothetical protein n=1 Tax=Chitinophaga sp. SYP-B3965 TaxID=2663120 RepID=UPI001299E8AD|nr:hypothetical protein [Chitinophaga sp. SYP-B3965]MRG48784.1 hypothetical protein [Chitinophaga sp. SYP-B3965]